MNLKAHIKFKIDSGTAILHWDAKEGPSSVFQSDTLVVADSDEQSLASKVLKGNLEGLLLSSYSRLESECKTSLGF
jgi:hypothetical protein